MVILFDRYNMPADILELIFSTKQQKIVAHELIVYIVKNGGEINKTEMSNFATLLHDGDYTAILTEPPYDGKTVKLSYNKRQFYDRILTPMKSMGIIDYDMYKKIYKISRKFKTDMIKIGSRWEEYLDTIEDNQKS
jgi:hypothetical protein